MEISRQKLVLVREQDFEYNQKISSSEDVIKFIRDVLEIQNESQEVFYLLTLDTRNRIISFMELGRGSIDMCSIFISDIFKAVLLSNSKKFIVLHNHPSGDSTPSKEDIETTKLIMKGAELLKIQMLDHIVIGFNESQSCMPKVA